MDVGSGGPWIPTERTNPVTLVQVFGSAPVIVAVFAAIWSDFLVPQLGFESAVATVIVVAGLSSLIDVWTWNVFRPAAVRVSASGIEIRRTIGRGLAIPADKVVLTNGRPAGFGVATYQGGIWYVLSPNQFAAARRYFPVTEPGALPTTPPRA
jgi:hypothetical protein